MVMMSREKKMAGPDLDARLGDDAPAVLVGERLPLHVFVDVLDHHDGAIHHGADGDGDAPAT